MTPTARLVTAAACFAAWLVMLLLGVALGGAVHVLLVAGIALAPWRASRPATSSKES